MVFVDPTFDRRSIPKNAIESVWEGADGWPIRRIDWISEQPVRGSVLFLPGRGDHYEKYLETLDFFARVNWRVTAIDWRGQGQSGRLLANPNVGHIDDFSTWISDLQHFWSKWKASAPAPHVVVAHSMGGHLAMRGLVEKAFDPDVMILSAPMLGIPTNGLPVAAHHWLVRFIGALGDPNRAAWKEGEKPLSPLNIRGKILTHDADRYADELFWWQERPGVRLGPPSWHWVERAIASTRLLAEPNTLEALDTPILALATTADRLVDTKRIINDVKRLKNAEVLLFGDEAAHELLREVDLVRNKCLAAMIDFIERKAPQ
jgi:lysophospholipase